MMMKKIHNLLNKPITPLFTIGIIAIMAWLFYWPVIGADVTYQDDASRTVGDSHLFAIHGRFSAEALSRIMSGMSAAPIDYGSLGQILGVLFIIAAIGILISTKLKFSARSILVVAPLLMNPFLLHNATYEYDGFGMLLGYALAILAFTVFKTSPSRLLATTLLLLISLGFYQAMPTVFLMLVAIEFIVNISKSKESMLKSVRRLILQGAAYAIATVLYMIVTRYIFIQTNDRSAVNLSLTSIPDNIGRLLDVVGAYFHGPSLMVIALSIIISACLVVTYAYKNSNRRNEGITRISLVLTGLVLLACTLLGPLLLTKDAIIFPRSVPSFALFGMIISAALIISHNKKAFTQSLLAVFSITYALQALIFAHTYGSYLQNQADYRDALISSAYNYIHQDGLEGTFYITGSSDAPVSAHKATRQYPVLKYYWEGPRAINTPAWTERILKNHNVKAVSDWKSDYPHMRQIICGNNKLKPINDNRDYSVYTVASKVEGEADEHMIFFKRKPENTYCNNR